MRCVHVIPYMAARAGGPVVVGDRLCRRMAGFGVESIVVTTDVLSEGRFERIAASDGGVGEYVGAGRTGVESTTGPWRVEGDWVGGGYERRTFHALTRRYAYSPALAAALDEIVPSCDLVHVHTLWTHTTAAAVRAARRHRVPFVVMPHGMLDPNALARKRLRKLLYGRLFEFARVRSAGGVIYTTEEERDLARRTVGSVAGRPPEYVVPLGADEPPGRREALARSFFAERPDLAGKTLVTFLGRVHPKKGLDLLVPAFADVAARVPRAHLLVVGPDEAGTWSRVRQQAEALGLAARVTRIDMLTGAKKWSALAASTLFVLPSYQENFAIAVAEAMRIGTPVVISERVNIRRTVESGGAGRVVPCDAAALGAAIQECLDAPEPAWRAMSDAAVAVAQRRYDWGRTAEAMLDVYDRVLRRGREVCGLAPGACGSAA